LALVLSTAAFFSSADRAAAVGEQFYGLNWSGAYDLSEEEWDAIGHSGTHLYRLNASWNRVSQAGNWRESNAWEKTYDKWVEQAAKRNISILADLVQRKNGGTTFYTSGDPEWGEWFEFVWTFVQRYGRGGSFWTARPSLPYRPITAWEVWNEPNLAANKPGGAATPPSTYAKFFNPTANTIREAQNAVRKAGEPVDTKVVVGGFLQRSDLGMQDTVKNFLTVLANETPNLSSEFNASYDGFGIHPYSFGANETESMNMLENAITVDRAAISNGKPIWITELGWAVTGEGLGSGEPAVDAATQASLLSKSFTWLTNQAVSKNIALANWYFFRDYPGQSAWDYHTGLRTSEGWFRKSWATYQGFTGAAAWPAPAAIPYATSSIKETEATLNGGIFPNGRDTTYRFEWGTSTNYGNVAPVTEGSVPATTAGTAVSATLTGLQQNKHYHFRIRAINSAGTTYSPDHSFSTGVKWSLRNSNTAGVPSTNFWFGLPGQVRVAGDWDGNGTVTAGSYDPSIGRWRLRNSNSTGGSETTFDFGGGPWTKPIVGDWDGNGTTTIGVYDPVAGNWNLRNSNSAGGANYAFQYGGGPWTDPVVGDWDGNGTTTIGVYDPTAGNWNMRDANSAGGATYAFQYGGNPWKAVVGDWDGNGTSTIGLYDPAAGNWNLRNTNSAGGPDLSFQFGGANAQAVTGDWDGNGTTTVGISDPNGTAERVWLARNTNSSGNPNVAFDYGVPGEVAVLGDWDGDGDQTPGTYTPSSGTWKLRNASSGPAEITFQFGGSPWTKPIVGDWDGNGTTTIGVYDPSAGNWNLRDSNSAGGANHAFQYGGSPWSTPLVGDWDGNGSTTIGVYDPTAGNWNLRNSLSSGNPSYSFQYGGGVWSYGIVGDWDGNGTTTIGVYEPIAGNWNLRNTNSGGNPSYSFQYGGSIYDPIVGDWDASGTDTIGLVTK